MNSSRPRWTEDELRADARVAATNFRTARLSATEETWCRHYTPARTKFEKLFAQLGDHDPQHFTNTTLALAYMGKLGEALRNLAGLPVVQHSSQVT